MASSQLSVFVSSKMEELAAERLAIKAALDELKIDGWVFEKDAGARAQSIQQTFLTEVERSDLYIGLFWKGYGDYTIEEFKHARHLGKDCLLYEKRADIEGQRDERLEKWLTELNDVENGLTRKWFNTSQELKEFVKQDVARWQAEIVRRYKVAGAPQVYQPPQPVEDRTRRELLILLDKVERFWIKGVLEHSVHQQFEIELGKEKVGDAVANPWETVLEVPNQTDAPTPIRGSISDLFADVNHHLLILGQPGSGKTITLLQLARELIAAARRNAGQPIPTVFNLSSWSNKEESIVDWMVRELTEKYQVPKKIGKVWLDQRLILPLLDGLDEVRSDLQDDCVRAINTLLEEYFSGLVVCCRLQEYMSLPVRLKLNGAICLQPLSLKQVEEYLERAGPSLAAFKHALAKDNSLRELIQTPLMLSIISLAYENAPLDSLESKSTNTVESLRADVFDTYIDRMVQRKGKARQVYSKENLNGWLGWLAQQMKSHTQTIFLVEQLQADWLATRRQRFFYILLSRVLGGLFMAAGLGLALALFSYGQDDSVKFALAVWLSGLAFGLVIGIVSALISCLKVLLNEKVEFVRRQTGFRRKLLDISIYTLPWLLFNGATLLLLIEKDSFMRVAALFVALLAIAPIIGLLHWFLFEARSERHRIVADITTVETLKWSGKAALKSGLKGAAIVGLLMFPVSIVWAFASISTAESLAETLATILLVVSLFVIPYGIFGGLLGFLFGGFKEGIVEKKTKPNQGITLTIRNALVGGLAIGLLLGVIVSLLFISLDYFSREELNLDQNILFLAQVSLFIGLPVAFRNGVYDAIKHYSLRAVLVFCKYIPRNYVKVLNYAAGLILLQRVGGGYIFIHRTLLEHYAATYGRDSKTVTSQ